MVVKHKTKGNFIFFLGIRLFYSSQTMFMIITAITFYYGYDQAKVLVIKILVDFIVRYHSLKQWKTQLVGRRHARIQSILRYIFIVTCRNLKRR